MNLYDIKTFCDNASDADLTILYKYISCEHARREANKAHSQSVQDFLKYMESSKDYDKMAYDLVKPYIAHTMIDVRRQSAVVADCKDPLSIARKLVEVCGHNLFLVSHEQLTHGIISLIKEFRQLSGKGLGESKHHVEKAVVANIADYIGRNS